MSDRMSKPSVELGAGCWRAIVDAMPDAFCVLEPETGRILDVNRSAVRMMGFTRREELIDTVIGSHRSDEPWVQQTLLELLEKARISGRQVFEWNARRADGSIYPVEISIIILELNGDVRALGIMRDVSEQKDADAHLRAILDAANDALFIHDLRAGVLVDVNRKAEDMYGYSREDFIGAGIGRISSGVPPYTERGALKWVLKVRSGKPQIIEWQARHADGHVFPVEVSVRSEEIGGRLLVIASVRDISERKLAEAALNISEERLRLATQVGGIGVWDLDIRNDQLIWDDRMYEMYEVAEDDFGQTYESWQKRVLPEDLAVSEALFAEALKQGSSFETAFRISRPDGAVRHIRALAKVILDPDGTPVRMVGTNMDITDEVESKQALAESERKFKSLVSNLPGASYRCLIDDEYTVTFISEGCRKLCGYTPDDFISRRISWSDLVHPDDGPRVEAACAYAIKHHEPYEYEYRLTTRDGEERWFWERGAAVYSDDGNPAHIEGFIADISDRKRAAAALDTFFEQAVNLHLITDLGGTIIRVNKGYEEVLGRPKEEVLNRNSLEFVHPDDIEKTKQVLSCLLKGESVEYFENRCLHADGTYRTLVWSASPALENGLVNAVAKNVTESKRAEQLAQTSLDALSAHIVILDEDARIIAANRAWECFVEEQGHSEVRSLGSNYLSAFEGSVEQGDEYTIRLVEGLRAVLAGKQELFSMEYHCLTDEEPLWFEIRVTSFPGADDQRVAVAHEDITVRKKTEFEKHESEQRYRALYENAPLPYQSLDVGGCFVDVNPAWLRMLGYERHEVIGHGFGDFLHPDYVSHFELNFPAFKARGHVSGVEFLLRHKQGHYRRVKFEGCIGYLPDGNFKQTYCVFQDITDQYEAERKLKEGEERLRGIVENSTNMFFTHTPDHELTYVSPQVKEIIGYREQEVMRRWTDLCSDHPANERAVQLTEAAIRTGKTQPPYELELMHKDGHCVWVEVREAPVVENGRTVAIVGSLTDVSQRKADEEALRASNKELSRFNRAATGRELRMIELKQEINALCRELGREEPYA